MTGAYDTRNLWYAPRIHIVHDLRWRPATTCTVTDSGLNLSSEPMVIQDIRWGVSQRDIENVTLTLERDETKDSGGLSSYLFPNYTKVVQGSTNTGGGGGGGGGSSGPWKPLPPPTTYPPNQGGGGYTGGTTGPIGGTTFTPFMYQGGFNQNAGSGNFSHTTNINGLTGSSYSNITGRMDYLDMGGEGTEWGLLGQDKPAIAKSSQRSVDGLDTLITPSSAGATTTNEGFVLPGIIDPDSSDRHTHTQSIKVRVPDDIADEMVSVDATYTMGGTSSSVAVLTATVECVETGTSKSRTFKIVGNESNKNLALMGTIPLQGVATKGNTVKVTIKRTAGTGDDDASYSSVVIHNVKVNFQRFSTKGRSNLGAFKTG